MDRKILYRTLLLNGGLLLLAVAYAIAFTVARAAGSDIFACRFLAHFGVNCPGCGGSRAVLALLRLDLLAALSYSAGVVYSVLLLLWYDVTVAVAYLCRRPEALRAFPRWSVLSVPFVFLAVFLIRLYRTLVLHMPPI